MWPLAPANVALTPSMSTVHRAHRAWCTARSTFSPCKDLFAFLGDWLIGHAARWSPRTSGNGSNQRRRCRSRVTRKVAEFKRASSGSHKKRGGACWRCPRGSPGMVTRTATPYISRSGGPLHMAPSMCRPAACRPPVAATRHKAELKAYRTDWTYNSAGGKDLRKKKAGQEVFKDTGSSLLPPPARFTGKILGFRDGSRGGCSKHFPASGRLPLGRSSNAKAPETGPAGARMDVKKAPSRAVMVCPEGEVCRGRVQGQCEGHRPRHALRQAEGQAARPHAFAFDASASFETHSSQPHCS